MALCTNAVAQGYFRELLAMSPDIAEGLHSLLGLWGETVMRLRKTETCCASQPLDSVVRKARFVSCETDFRVAYKMRESAEEGRERFTFTLGA
jgi:hypothetical protein